MTKGMRQVLNSLSVFSYVIFQGLTPGMLLGFSAMVMYNSVCRAGVVR
jgi:hypothetical protein